MILRPCMALSLLPFALAAQEAHRCAVPELSPQALRQLRSGSMASGFQSRQAAGRVQATPAPKVAHSEHFTVAWLPSPTGDAPRDSTASFRDTLPSAMAAIPAGDTVPEAVRLCLTTLEAARRLAVDTLGLRPPLPAASSWHWGIPSTEGRYVVELMRVDRASFPDLGLNPNLNYFALTIPRGDAGHSNLALAADWTGGKLAGWHYTPDTSALGASIQRSYATDWRPGLAATAVHELMHAVQFRYERNLDHFFFEAGAVGFEDRAAPWTLDWPQYAPYLYGEKYGDLRLDDLSFWAWQYAQGIFAQSLDLDCPDGFLARFWGDRETVGGDVLGTLGRSVSGCAADFPGLFGRHAVRMMGSGRRTPWLPRAAEGAPLSPFRMALAMPPLRHDSLATGASIAGQFLSNPPLTPTFRALGPQDSATAVVLATPSLRTVHALDPDTLRSGREFLLLPPSDKPRWIGLVNPGRDTAGSWFAVGPAPSAVPLSAGAARTWPLQGAVLSGTPRDSGQARVWDCVDCWKPHTDDTFVRSVDSGHVHRLYDFEGRLRLSGVQLSFPLPPTGSGKVWQGDGMSWKDLGASVSGSRLAVAMDTLDLRTPATFLVAAGISGDLQAMVAAPYPNPFRARHTAIRFPLLIWSPSPRLTIRSSDGTLVASLRPEEGRSEVAWHPVTATGRPVAPGLYFYHWTGATGAVEGRLLIGR